MSYNKDHHEETFFQKYIWSVDHKVIGIQYGITSLLFLLFGFCLMMVMRYQLAYPETPIPVVGWFFKESGGIMLPENYNTLGAMHGTIMIFLGVVPLAVGAFGNYLVPLQIGAPDMAFPKLNASSYWSYFVGGVIMLASFFTPEGAARSGWTSYPPLSIFESGQTMWLCGMIFLITSSLLGSMNIIVTIVQLRAPGLTWYKLPFFIWTQLITSFLLVLAFPPLEAASILQLMDRLAGTSFFLPSGLVYAGNTVEAYGSGSPLLWQHLFWFLAHPEVYVLILPAIGIVGETGSGKSTLIDLLTGLIKPNNGAIEVDGITIAKNLSSWIDKIGYVPQNVYLTDNTIAQNISFGYENKHISPEEVEKVIEDAQLSKFVRGLKNGTKTMVGERAVKISGGERQRIGIARALYRNPDILLFDEATSALDIETENNFFNTLNNLRKKKTIIFITHRKNNLNFFNQIFLLENNTLKKI